MTPATTTDIHRPGNAEQRAGGLPGPEPGLDHHPGLQARWLVSSHRQVRYEVRISDDAFDPARLDVLECPDGTAGGGRRLVVLDRNVDRAHGRRIRDYLRHHGVAHRILLLDAHEAEKDFRSVARVVEAMDDFGLSRRSEPVLAVGGGVLTDVVGLATSLYRRGTPFVRVPTTLIGLVDAGVGAKTGINFNGGKNRLGTYAPAGLTLLDRSFLRSLDRRHISNGLAEILKLALIKDSALFDLLEHAGPSLLRERFQGATPEGDRVARAVLQAATHAMLEELQPNLWEDVLERCVDYGHTFSPTIEMRGLPNLLHGEAVAVDMALTTVLAHQRGLMTGSDRDRVLAVMAGLGLPSTDPSLDLALLRDALHDTTLHRDGRQRMPLPVGIGGVTFVDDVTERELRTALEVLRRLGAQRPR